MAVNRENFCDILGEDGRMHLRRRSRASVDVLCGARHATTGGLGRPVRCPECEYLMQQQIEQSLRGQTK